jgi:mono/diheme cytochrome c family protein
LRRRRDDLARVVLAAATDSSSEKLSYAQAYEYQCDVRFLLALALTACEREQRRFTEIGPLSGRPQPQANTQLRPGMPGAPGAQGKTTVQAPYGENAWAIAEGKRLYNWFNCVGCHAQGGGGMGPPLMPDGPPSNILHTSG